MSKLKLKTANTEAKESARKYILESKYTLQSIADETGCSIATVNRIAADIKKERKNDNSSRP